MANSSTACYKISWECKAETQRAHSDYSVGFVTAVEVCTGLTCFGEANCICLHRFLLAISVGLWHPVISWPKWSHLGVHSGIFLKKCLHFRGGSSLQEEREREEYKRDCPASYHVLRNTEQHHLDRLVNNCSSIRQVIPALYALVSIYI